MRQISQQQQKEIIGQVEAIVRDRMSEQQAGHGLDHVWRVRKSARLICEQLDCDRFVVELAALLHDLGDAKFHQGVERSGEFAEQILGALKVDPETIRHVVLIVDNLSFRKRHEAQPLSIEGQIVQDADRLDALGAIGIVRTIEYGASIGQPFYQPALPDAKSGVGHFHEKLFKLRDLMNTEAARELAAEREAFMRGFLEQFALECDDVDGSAPESQR